MIPKQPESAIPKPSEHVISQKLGIVVYVVLVLAVFQELGVVARTVLALQPSIKPHQPPVFQEHGTVVPKKSERVASQLPGVEVLVDTVPQ